MRHVATYVLTMALCVGTAGHAATPPPQESRSGDEPVMSAGTAAVTDGAKVTIGFTLMVPETRQSIPNNVSEYTLGEDELNPALEDALMGMKPGEHKRVELQPEEAFGRYDKKKMMKIRRDMLPPTAQAGSIYQTSDGHPITVVALEDSTAVVDLNHPLAGRHLVIDVEVLGVEQPS